PIRELLAETFGDQWRLRQIGGLERRLSRFVAHVDEAEHVVAEVNRRAQQSIASGLEHDVRKARLRIQPVDEEGRPSAATAIDDRIGAIGERPDDASKSILGDQLETCVVGEQVKRGLRGADFNRTVIKDFLQLALKLLNLGMHVRSVPGEWRVV